MIVVLFVELRTSAEFKPVIHPLNGCESDWQLTDSLNIHLVPNQP